MVSYLYVLISFVSQYAFGFGNVETIAIFKRKTCFDNEISENVQSLSQAMNMEECALKCSKSPIFDSFFFNNLTGQCGFLSSTNNTISFTMEEQGWMYFHLRSECCDKDWTYFRGSCFQIQLTKREQDEAQIKCQEYGGSLAEAYRQEIDQFLTAEKAKIGLSEDLWIGGSDSAAEGHWVWITSGRNFTYTNWKPNGEPNNLNGIQHCIVHGDDDTWRDVGCTRHKYSVCQKDVVTL